MADQRHAAAVLIVDRDSAAADNLVLHLAELGLSIEHVPSLDQGLAALEKRRFEAVLLKDQPDEEIDSDTIAAISRSEGHPEIVVYSSAADSQLAEQAFKLGVWEYLVDPSPHDALLEIIRSLIVYRENKIDNPIPDRKSIHTQLEKTGIVGRSGAMKRCIDECVVLAQSDANVLISGESGTGKELFARAIHELSSRAGRPFTIVDCTALPPSLIESILFGHVRGSFTGADKAQRGLIEQANGGTLFLDEIGEIPQSMQKKLLRVIQERTYLPIGSTTERKVDFRLIAATNRDLHSMVEAGEFREDLLFRLKTLHLELPPLRERASDITELAYHQRNLICRQQKLSRKKFSPEYLLQLAKYDWPGNVRELFQAIERSIIEARESDILYPPHLPSEIRTQVLQQQISDEEDQPFGAGIGNLHADDYAENPPTLKEAREQAVDRCEKAYLENLLTRTGGDIKACCDIAGLSRSRLYDLLKKHDLSKPNPTLSGGT